MLLPLFLTAGLASAPLAQDWIRLPRPTLTRPSAFRDSPREVRSSVHLPALDEVDPEPPARRPTELPLATVRELVDGAVRAAVGRSDLRVEALGDELLLSGDAGAIDVAREVLAELDALDRALRLELDVVLVGGTGERRLGRWIGRSGDRAGVGTREELPYLARYDINLAADSAAVEPEVWPAWTGTTVHLSASRWSDDAVLVEGHLDVAALRGIETFDPDDVDLGRIELPELDVLEVVFAGLVRAGEPLRVTFAGLPEDLVDGTLEIRLGPLAELPRGVHWRAFDLAAHAWRAGLPGPAPRDREEEAPDVPVEEVPGAPPASFALLLGEGSLTGGPIWSDGLLFVPPAAGPSAEALLAALREGATEVRVRASEGDRTVSFPALPNRPVRLVLGREHNRLVRYRAQVAPEAWVLEPIVDRRHVGLVLEGTIRAGSSFEGRATARRTVDGAPLSSAFTGSSALQRAGRRATSASVRVGAGAGGAVQALDGLELRIEIE